MSDFAHVRVAERGVTVVASTSKNLRQGVYEHYIPEPMTRAAHIIDACFNWLILAIFALIFLGLLFGHDPLKGRCDPKAGAVEQWCN